MAVTNLPVRLEIADILKSAVLQFPMLKFQAGDMFYWNALGQTVTYSTDHPPSQFIASLYHEIGHSQLDHRHFNNDVELLVMEREAWTWAAKRLNNTTQIVTRDMIDDSLDTYREWLYRRALCPRCDLVGIQISSQKYQCIYCRSSWTVSRSRLCSVRRRLQTQ